MKPKHWFPFMIRDELDMLECQLYEYYDFMHKFIVVEATVDHQGHPKELYYADNKSRFAQYSDKIIHVIVDWLPDITQSSDNWAREQAQRNAAGPAFLDDAHYDDVVIVADVDEFPAWAALERAEVNPVLGLKLNLRFAAVDWWGSPGVNGVLATAGFAKVTGIDRLRQLRETFPVFVDPKTGSDFGGWHFSWLGGQEAIRTKLAGFCHVEESFAAGTELNETDSMYRLGMTWPGGDYGTPAPVDETYPRWIYERKCPANWFRPSTPEVP